MYNCVQWCIFEYILFKGCGKCGGFCEEVNSRRKVVTVFVKSGYDAIFNAKMLCFAIQFITNLGFENPRHQRECSWFFLSSLVESQHRLIVAQDFNNRTF